MDADENGILLRVFDRDPLLEWNKNVGRTRHHDFQIGFTELSGKTFRDIQRGDFLRPAKLAVSAVVFAAVSRIDHDGTERFARISRADFNRTWRRSARGEENRRNKK